MNHIKKIKSIPRMANMIHTKTLENNDKRKIELRSKLELILVKSLNNPQSKQI